MFINNLLLKDLSGNGFANVNRPQLCQIWEDGTILNILNCGKHKSIRALYFL